MTDEVYAEDAPYWGTSVPDTSTAAEIMEMLLEYGIPCFAPMRGQAGGKPCWMLRFERDGRTYRLFARPLPCRYPTATKTVTRKGRKRQITHAELAEWQALRHLAHMLKPVLEMVYWHPDMADLLFGYMELPEAAEPGRPAPTAAELGAGLPRMLSGLMLPAPPSGVVDDGDVVEGDYEERP